MKKDISYYFDMGRECFKLKAYKKSLENFEKVLELYPKYKEAYYNKAVIYFHLKEYDEAKKIFKEIINLDIKKNKKTDKITNKIIIRDDISNILIDILIDNMYKLDSNQKEVLVELIVECCALMETCKVKDAEYNIIHYTKINTLKALLKKEKDLKEEEIPKIRLNNTIHMNDPEEGKIFKNLLLKKCESDLDKENIIENVFKIDSDETVLNSNYCTFLACFCDIKEEKEKLSMWLHYGEEGKGVGIVFKEEFFKGTDLYRVQYRKENKIEESLEKICNILVQSEILQKCVNMSEENKDFLELINIILNYVSYLFKDEAYSYENEVRIVKLKDYDDEEIKIFDDGYGMPKLYINFEKDVKPNMIEEIIVGPKGDFERIASYARYAGVKKISKSKIKYR